MTFRREPLEVERHESEVHSRPLSHGVKTSAITLVVILVAAYAYIFSQWMYPIYYLGDQLNYTTFWYSVDNASLSDVWKLQLIWTGSVEPVFGVIVWTASRFFEKIQFFSVINVVFSLLLVATLLKYRVSLFVYPLLLFNYYYILLLIPAERLKVSLIFILVFILVRGAKSYIAFGFGTLTHFQNLVFLASLTFAKVASAMRGVLLKKRLDARSLFGMIMLASGGMFFFLQFRDALARKFDHYFEVALSDALDAVVMLVLVLVFCQNRLTALAVFFPIVTAAVLLGEERISMVAFLVFSVFFVAQHKSLHPAFVSILIYLDIKAIYFIQHVLEYNTGFGR